MPQIRNLTYRVPISQLCVLYCLDHEFHRIYRVAIRNASCFVAHSTPPPCPTLLNQCNPSRRVAARSLLPRAAPRHTPRQFIHAIQWFSVQSISPNSYPLQLLKRNLSVVCKLTLVSLTSIALQSARHPIKCEDIFPND